MSARILGEHQVSPSCRTQKPSRARDGAQVTIMIECLFILPRTITLRAGAIEALLRFHVAFASVPPLYSEKTEPRVHADTVEAFHDLDRCLLLALFMDRRYFVVASD